MFKTAIVRTPCEEMIHGISSASLGLPDFNLAQKQHAGYVEALRSCGLKVTVLEPDSRFPDSTFVEDVALCFSRFAVLTNPGAPSRNGEKMGMAPVLSRFFSIVKSIEAPGTLDAGDVMMVGNHFYIGRSERTNEQGAAQLMNILQKHGMSGEAVPLKEMLHLKTGSPTLKITGCWFLENFVIIRLLPALLKSRWSRLRVMRPTLYGSTEPSWFLKDFPEQGLRSKSWVILPLLWMFLNSVSWMAD